jgi:phenylalanyl-tRNA synthetase alpha chain
MVLKFTEIDAKVYEYIKQKKECSFEEILKDLKINEDSIRRTIEYLKSFLLISENIQKIKKFSLDINAKKSIEKGFIEEIFCDFCKNNNVLISDIKKIKIDNLEPEEKTLAFGIAKKKGLISIEDGVIVVSNNYKKKINDDKQVLINIKENKQIEKETIEEFLKRKNFIIEEYDVTKKYSLEKIEHYEIDKDKINELTPDLLKTDDILEKEFKEYDVEKLSKPLIFGRIHPLRQIIYYLRDVFLQMGFSEMKGPFVETCFWNMDSMFISQDHPARDIQDTFYLKEKGKLPNDNKLLTTIAELHLNGGETGSLGYGYVWDEEKAKQLVLRTHTTATTYRTFYELKHKESQKYFSIDKVFRNETIDATHLPEFYQAEGFVIGEDLSLADLLGFIKEFLGRLGITEIKFKPNYNPYTEPSLEAFAYFKKYDKWLEIINAGIFRPEATKPYNITQKVIAWGFGVERIAMLIYEKSIKEVNGDECDLNWLRTYPLPKRTL